MRWMVVQGEAFPSPGSQLGSLGTASERFIEEMKIV